MTNNNFLHKKGVENLQLECSFDITHGEIRQKALPCEAGLKPVQSHVTCWVMLNICREGRAVATMGVKGFSSQISPQNQLDLSV